MLSRLALACAVAVLLASCSKDSGNVRKQSAQNTANARPPVEGEIRYQPRSMDEIASLLDELPVQDLTEEHQDALAFIRATDADDSDSVRQLIADGREAAAQIGDVTALHFAVRNGNIPIIKLLLDADDNRDYGLPGGDELTLELACRGMDEKVLRKLKSAGLVTEMTGRDVFRPLDLDYADNPAMLDVLLEVRPDEFTFKSMLDRACRSSDPAYLRKLLRKFGDIREEPGIFESAIHSREMMQVLIDSGLDIHYVENTSTYEGDDLPNPLLGSIGTSSTFMQIIDPQDTFWLYREFTGPPDSIADILQFLLENGSDFNAPFGKDNMPAWQRQIGMTPALEVLQAFSALGYDPLAQWNDNTGRGYPGYLLIDGTKEIERSLQAGEDPLAGWQELGFDLSLRVPDGRTLLGEALLEGHEALSTALLDREVAYGLQEAAGLGRLDEIQALYDQSSAIERTRACSMAAILDQTAAFELLLSLGAEPELRDLVLTGRHAELRAALQAGQDPGTFFDEHIRPLPPRIAPDEPARFNAVRAACYVDDPQSLAILAEHGANLEYDDEEKAGLPPPLMICLQNDCAQALGFLLDRKVISSSGNYDAALQRALTHGSIDSAVLLLDRHEPGQDEWTAFNLAASFVGGTEPASADGINELLPHIPAGLRQGFLDFGLLKEMKKLAANYYPYEVGIEEPPVLLIDSVRDWLEAGADPDSKDLDEQFPTDSSNGVMELAMRSGNQELLGLLVEYGGSMPSAGELAPLLLQDYLLGEIRLNYGSQQY